MIVAALGAEGETVVHDGQHVDRGYENLDAKMAAVGADVVRLEE
jgi:UDP-N-acetylglucosamine 1-carboxyvinyltransferase